jgi:carbamoyl-phosphate synthase large subunit
MEIVSNNEELRHYITEATLVSAGNPVLIDRFLEGALELDVDVLTDGDDVWIAGLMEQIEEAGVHSGDSACVLPPVSLSETMVTRIEDTAAALVTAMGAVGLVNIQMAVKGSDLYILEANPRASRTVPYVSKAIGIPVAKLAAKVLVGNRLRDLLHPYWPYPHHKRPSHCSDSATLTMKLDEVMGLGRLAPTPWPQRVSVKEVVLPFGRFPGADTLLGPEMRSTGEVMSFGASFPEAFAKAQIAAGNPLPASGAILASLADSDKREGIALLAQLNDMGFSIMATRGTNRALQAMGIDCTEAHKVGEGRPDCVDLISQGHISFVVNTPTSEQELPQSVQPELPSSSLARSAPLSWEGPRSAGYRIRAAALQYHIPYVTTLVALRTTVASIRYLRAGKLPVQALVTREK